MEGVQAPGGEAWWNAIQNQTSHYSDLNPSQHTERNWKLGAARLLLEQSENINKIDWAGVVITS